MNQTKFKKFKIKNLIRILNIPPSLFSKLTMIRAKESISFPHQIEFVINDEKCANCYIV